MVAPGGYALIGPGEANANYQNAHPKRTYIGFRTDGSGAGNNTTRYIDLDPTLGNLLPVQNNTNSPPGDPTSGSVTAPAMLAIDSPHRLSVSEPLFVTGSVDDYDKMETEGGITSQGALAGGAGVDPNGQYTQIYDIPFDLKRNDPDSGVFWSNGTAPMFRVIYLQRLANPLLAYDPTNNPYRTIDAMPVDLTVFNGLTNLTDSELKPGVATHFEARQRGENNDPPGSFNVNGGLNPDMNLWKQEPVNKTAWDATSHDITNHYFNKGLKHSLGYLNQPFGLPQATPLVGDPSQPFPWLTSNGRPYVSPLDLLLVPTCSSSKLLINAGANTSDPNCNKYFNILRPTDSPQPYTVNTLFGAGVPYPHLLNFFQSNPSTSAGTSPQFHRILEYLGVPSPFVATETWTNPNPSYVSSPYLPPFNRISAFREPGRINLNTIYDQNVFNGLMAGCPAMQAKWPAFVQSRRGDGNPILAAPASSMPTEFAHPFRSFGGWSMTVPPIQASIAREIDCTLLRSDPTAPTQPLFQPAISTQLYNDMNRNPFFRYQGLERLSNLVTTRSNLYAVWITVGYFEVTQAPTGYNPAIYPDGYQLGRELGTDTGDLQRHRAFYIFDRTIPVGFQRGQDMNVDKAILVNRFIE